MCAVDCVVGTWYITIAIAYISASFVTMRSSSPNLDGARSSGAMKGMDPSPLADSDVSIPISGSRTTTVDPKSARRVDIGVVRVIRILA